MILTVTIEHYKRERKTISPCLTAQAGFSLFEVLVALVIMSLATLALFQSFYQLSAVSRKSVEASEQVLDQFSQRAFFEALVLGITPQWEGREDFTFTGEPNRFQALSMMRLWSDEAQLFPITVQITQDSTAQTYMSMDVADQRLVYSLDAAKNPQISYLGWDQTWYSQWPPEEVPSTGYFDDFMFVTMPQIPIAIKIADEQSPKKTYYLAGTSQNYNTPAYAEIFDAATE